MLKEFLHRNNLLMKWGKILFLLERTKQKHGVILFCVRRLVDPDKKKRCNFLQKSGLFLE